MHWYKQDPAKPLFPDLLWSRPENKQRAGKLLIIGGNLHSIAAPATAYNIADQTGAGVIRVILPESLRKTIGKAFPEAQFAPATPSGSFAKKSLDTWLEGASWSDAVLLAGDVGHNSETSILTETFLEKYSGPVCITHDCIDQFVSTPLKLLPRSNTTIVLSFSQLHKMWRHLGMSKVLAYGNDLLTNIEVLHELSEQHPAHIVTKHADQIIVASQGRVSTTPSSNEIWRVQTASKTVVWWLQNPTKPFEAITTAIL